MISLASKAAGILAAADVPAQYKWATKCDYEGQDWDKFAHFSKVAPYTEKNRDTCMLASAYMFGIADVNSNFGLEKCEHMYACLAATYEKGQSKAEEAKKAKMCAVSVTKGHAKLDPW